jgi:hypothetical protein
MQFVPRRRAALPMARATLRRDGRQVLPFQGAKNRATALYQGIQADVF